MNPLPHEVITYTFGLGLVVLVFFFRSRRQQMWHETVRLALEKGQPVPEALMSGWGGRCGYYRSGRWLQKGLFWIAVGVGLYLVNSQNSRSWGILPICVGIAFLAGGLISQVFSKPDQNANELKGKNPTDLR